MFEFEDTAEEAKFLDMLTGFVVELQAKHPEHTFTIESVNRLVIDGKVCDLNLRRSKSEPDMIEIDLDLEFMNEQVDP